MQPSENTILDGSFLEQRREREGGREMGMEGVREEGRRE